MSLQLDYFYGNEAEEFTFYRIPKLLVTSPQFRRVSDSAKLLYGLMLDRMSLSVKNGWFDEQNRAYIYFTVNDIMEQMLCGTEKATKLVAELDSVKGIGLIERVKQGQGKPAKVYLKKFTDTSQKSRLSESESHETGQTEAKMAKTQTFDNQKSRVSETESQDFGKSKVQTFGNRKSRVSEIESADFRKPKCNDNNINNTDLSEINPINHSDNSARWIDRYNKTIAEIKEQIEYDSLIADNDTEIIDNIVNVMTDVMLLDEPYYTIEGKSIPAELVRIRYRQITYSNLEAFLLEFRDVYFKIHNTKAYLTTALYNVALTASMALTNRVNNDLRGGE